MDIKVDDDYCSEEVFEDLNKNNRYDVGEQFSDLGNGIWDEGENFVDLDGNGIYDEWDEFKDTGNGKWDSAEKFTDINKNAIWDGENKIYNEDTRNSNFLKFGAHIPKYSLSQINE